MKTPASRRLPGFLRYLKAGAGHYAKSGIPYIGLIMASIKAISSLVRPYFLYNSASVHGLEKSFMGTNSYALGDNICVNDFVEPMEIHFAEQQQNRNLRNNIQDHIL